MKTCFLSFVYYCVYVKINNAQYTNVHQETNPECDGSYKAYLIEKFFNLIFSEFQNTLPACVCVQMCPDQPTYCYPNGCMRPMDHKKFTDEGGTLGDAASNLEGKQRSMEEGNPFVYFVDDKGSLNDLAQTGVVKKVRTNILTGLQDLMKDRVKILFKYKKTPKIEVRYHLKEHVNHMNMDKQRIDLNLKQNNRDREVNPSQPFRYKVIKPYIASGSHNLKNFGKYSPKPPINAFLVNDFQKRSFNKRDLKKNLDDLDDLKATVLLKHNKIPGNDVIPVVVYSIIDELINATALKDILEKAFVNLDDEKNTKVANSDASSRDAILKKSQ